MGLHVTVHQHGDADLWCWLGAFATDREVLRELGGPIYSTEGSVWFVAEDDAGEVVGWASLRVSGETLWYDYGYVVPAKRGKGIFGRIARVRDRHARRIEAQRQRIVVRADRWKHYAQRGWKIMSRRGSWVHAERQK